MIDQQSLRSKLQVLRGKADRRFLYCGILFGLYAFYLLIEVLDFLAMLHSKEPDFSPTYNIVHVAYFMVEMAVAMGLGLWMGLLYQARNKNYSLMAFFFILVTIGRMVLVYYLYIYTEPTSHWVPFIYKKANELSDIFRFSFAYAQIFFCILGAVMCIRVSLIKAKLEKSNVPAEAEHKS